MRSTPWLLSFIWPFLAACQGSDSRSMAQLNGAANEVELTEPGERDIPLSRIIDSLRLDAGTVRFHVDKSDRVFEVLVNDTVRKRYPCVLGESPVGDKFHQGDRRTPEGTFTFRSKRVHDQWHKFIWVDYPNATSWKRYKERQAQGLIPAGKDIGGEIGIHGVPDGMDRWIEQGQDWTWGCIALRNADVDEIYPYIRAERTVIEIVP